MPAQPFSVNIRHGSNNGTIVFSVSGPLVLEHLCQFREVWDAHTEPVFIFDLSGLSYLDSAAVGFLVNSYISRQKNGKMLALTGLDGMAKRILTLTRVTDVLRIYPSVEEAESDFERTRRASA